MIGSATPALEDSIRSLGMGRLSLRQERSFVGKESGLQPALVNAEPWLLPAINALAEGLPLPKTVAPFIDKPFFRPPGSYRSFYYCPSTLAPAEFGASGAVMAIKGLEPCARDIDALFRDLQRACYSPYNIAEHFVFVEDKIPACLGLREAIREAERAAEIQRAHLRVYGAPARLPMPLFVFRHHDEILEQVTDKLCRSLDAAAFERIRSNLSLGLGVYVYYYPTAPMRARDIDHMLLGLDYRERLFALLRDVCDPEDVISRWAREFTRMLYLGFLPGSLASLRSGVCCQPQNACIDGGFVDLDSLTPLHELQSETAIQAALQVSVEALIQTVRTLVACGSDPTRAEGLEIRIDLHYFRQYVFALIEEAIKTEARPGIELDPRIRRYFASPRTFEELAGRLRFYYSPRTELDPAAGDYHELARELLRAARGSR